MRSRRDTELRAGEHYLSDRGIPEARLDVELLLAHALGVDRVELHARPQVEVPGEAERAFRQALEERGRGRPIAHLLGGQEFYGLFFEVNETVLIPRPESELLVDWALELTAPASSVRVADLGTGSGCLAISFAVHRDQASVDAVDLSSASLVLAQRNAKRHRVEARVRFFEGDLVEPLEGMFSIVIANPPYVALEDPRLDPHVETFEPGIALFDVHDGDGLGFYRRLAREALGHLTAGGSLLVEMPERQAPEIVRIFESAGAVCSEVRDDLAGVARAARFGRGSETAPFPDPGALGSE